jgi:hypothetical protein
MFVITLISVYPDRTGTGPIIARAGPGFTCVGGPAARVLERRPVTAATKSLRFCYVQNFHGGPEHTAITLLFSVKHLEVEPGLETSA